METEEGKIISQELREMLGELTKPMGQVGMPLDIPRRNLRAEQEMVDEAANRVKWHNEFKTGV